VLPPVWLVGTFGGPGAKGVLVGHGGQGEGAELAVDFTLIGMRPDAAHRVVLSEQSCAEDFVLGFPYEFTANSRGQRSQAFTLENTLISSLRSVRIRERIDGHFRAAGCAPLRLYDQANQEGATASLRERGGSEVASAPAVVGHVTIFRGPAAKGIIFDGNAGDDLIRVRAVVTGLLASQEYSFIAGMPPCAESWASSDRVLKVRADSSSNGGIWRSLTTPVRVSVAVGDVNGDGVVDAADYLVWRVKRASTGHQVGCYRADASLAKHPA
jgi:hypothetical protein